MVDKSPIEKDENTNALLDFDIVEVPEQNSAAARVVMKINTDKKTAQEEMEIMRKNFKTAIERGEIIVQELSPEDVSLCAPSAIDKFAVFEAGSSISVQQLNNLTESEAMAQLTPEQFEEWKAYNDSFQTIKVGEKVDMSKYGDEINSDFDEDDEEGDGK